jgi:aryl-alcohol dehydrogenase-like predicted oxidoreductase
MYDVADPAGSFMALQIINETLPALQQLKAQGLVRFVGITGLPLKALQYVLDRVPTGGRSFLKRAAISCTETAEAMAIVHRRIVEDLCWGCKAT